MYAGGVISAHTTAVPVYVVFDLPLGLDVVALVHRRRPRSLRSFEV